MDLNTKIIIVGAGAFGSSTAYHLSSRGYKSIKVLDRYPIPSCEAASTDISKIIRSDYNEPLYASLGIESIKAWKSSPLFQGLYHVPGWVLSACSQSVPFVKGSIETSTKLGVQGLKELTKDGVRKKFPIVTGLLDGWNINVWNPTAGWANAGEALRRMALAAKRNGVEYVSGKSGHVRGFIYNDLKCSGVKTYDGSIHRGDIIIVAAGAWTPSLIDVEGQLTAKGHSVAHIQLSLEETKRYAKLPILDNLELGYFFPPLSDGVFKMAHSKFITNTTTDKISNITTSIPHTFIDHPTDDLPIEIERTMRRNLHRVLPELSHRPFSYTRLCWDADTADRHFLITPHPRHKGLYFATGGSAHGFKFLPVLGKYIADMVEGKLDPTIAHAWRWRAREVVDGKNLAHPDGEVELSQLSGWKGIKKVTRL